MKISVKKYEKKLYDWWYKKGKKKKSSIHSIPKLYNITLKTIKFYEKQLELSCTNKIVLEYGCGSGSYAFYLAKNGAHVIGIDISSEGIKEAQEKAKELDLSNIQFYVMDAEQLGFNYNSFDIICGTGILHHLNLSKSLNEINKILKKNGSVIFLEPMGQNPFLSLLRKIIPHVRTKDEHPLTYKDLKLIDNYFQHTRFEFFHLFSIFAIFFRNFFIFKYILDVLVKFDKLIAKCIPPLKLLSWQIVLILNKPKKKQILI
ncbi:MAG: class I SAM-dependent methyltransferase [Candidatus Helarchaeota archaeon]